MAANELYGRFSQHAGRLAFGVALDDAAGWARRALRHARYAEGSRVRPGAVATRVIEDGRVCAGNGIQLRVMHWTAQGRRVPLAPRHPLINAGFFRAAFHEFLQKCERRTLWNPALSLQN